MILIGEKINTVNKDVLAALRKRDESYFKKLAVSQIDSGIIDVLDINVGTDINVEPDNMRWAITCIEEVLKNKIILSIDSPNPKTIIAGINSVHNKKGTFINSITFEENRYKELLPLAKEFDLNIIALPIDKNGISDNPYKRLEIAGELAELVSNFNIPLSKLYIDCLVEPISLSCNNGIIALDTINLIKKKIPQVNTIICLTGISFGLPDRKLLNRNFLTLLIREGIDAVILDPLDNDLVSSIFATELLTGKDEYCQKYLKHIRGET